MLRAFFTPRPRVLLCALALAAVAPEVPALTYHLAVDVPSTLGGATFNTNQIVRSDNAVYALQTALPAGSQIAALHRRPDGVWLFAPAHPQTFGGTTFEPRDLVSFNGAVFGLVLDGSVVGIPEWARIDALYLDAGGDPVLSFDVPVNLGGVEHSRSDLVEYNGAFVLVWDAEAAGVPAGSNVVGAAVDGAGTLVVSFDVPTTIGAATFLPGQLVSRNGGVFASYFVDAGWPASAQLRDFALVPASGFVPDGHLVLGPPLEVTHAPAGQIRLAWSASCSSTDSDYEIYEGVLGSYYSHTMKFCTTGGALTQTFLPAGSSSYYLVVPRNSVAEGGYGFNSAGGVRPPGAASCLSQSVGTCL